MTALVTQSSVRSATGWPVLAQAPRALPPSPVQNANGSKLATDAQLVGAVTQLTTATARLSSILVALGSPAQAPAAAASTPATGTVTATAVTPTSGTAALAGGSAVISFAPTLGLPVRVVLRGGATFTAYVGTSVDGCATINPLTVAGQQWATFTASADEYVDTPVSTATAGGIKYCLVVTVTSGTETYGVRQ